MAEGGDKISVMVTYGGGRRYNIGYDHLWLREGIKYRLWSPMAEGGDKISVMITYG